MSLQFRARMPDRGFDVALDVAEGETLAVLGPNGAGKSTLLALLAGLLRPAEGRADLDGTVLFDVPPASRRGTVLPPHRRGVSLLAQEALLFPHLTALENVAFGPRSRRGGDRSADPHTLARTWLDEVDASGLAGRRPHELSGGQAQRIAVARALASEPRLLLLDEPMAALDAAVAPALRRTLRRVLAGRTAIIVTHDILDAFTLADRVVVMDGGRIVDSGPTRTVLDRPTSPFHAGLAGLNLLVGTVAASTPGGGEVDVELDVELGVELGVEAAGTRVRARADAPLEPGRPAAVAIRPSHITVTVTPPATDTTTTTTAATATATEPGHTVLEAHVLDLEQRGDVVRLRTEHLAADLTPGEAAALDLTEGQRVWCRFAQADALAYPR
ncbi:sulfate/molybdate ABC transporter ATP-binding protein [Herbiconiux solani]|uniref:sulfate/molybdate ABC transporter ATP-binding protein n=1 Tax=Herbiconiux solani TaxID=661329 RepID=UPI000825FE72|nr:ABC transporter ATP-binding protein [Herbiconiux solani]